MAATDWKSEWDYPEVIPWSTKNKPTFKIIEEPGITVLEPHNPQPCSNCHNKGVFIAPEHSLIYPRCTIIKVSQCSCCMIEFYAYETIGTIKYNYTALDKCNFGKDAFD